MISGNDGRISTGRRQATALLVSALFHFMALSALFALGLHRVTEFDARIKDVVFISPPMSFYSEPLASVGRRESAAGVARESADRGAVPDRKKPEPSAPEPPPPPVPVAENQGAPLQAAAPALPERVPAKRDPEEFGLREGMPLPSFSPSSYGLAFGRSGPGGAGAEGGLDRGTGKTAAIGAGLPGLSGGDGVREGAIGTDTGPQLIKMSPPVYPRHARRMGREGRVVLSVVIDESGRLVEARVIEKAGHGFDEAALEAVRLSKFKPALENGIPVSCRARLAIRFRLNDSM